MFPAQITGDADLFEGFKDAREVAADRLLMVEDAFQYGPEGFFQARTGGLYGVAAVNAAYVAPAHEISRAGEVAR